MPSNQSSQIGRRYTHFTFRLGFLLGSLLVTAWMPVGQAQPANAHSKETFTYKKVGDLEIKADVYRMDSRRRAHLWQPLNDPC
jgi:hypothetical protein